MTAGATTTFDKVRAIEDWMGAHTEYSLNAPLSPPNVDVVDDFLFRSRIGWCEQIASSLVVLARSVGIPARLVTGFVPGTQDALTGRPIGVNGMAKSVIGYIASSIGVQVDVDNLLTRVGMNFGFSLLNSLTAATMLSLEYWDPSSDSTSSLGRLRNFS